jgi:ABC-2 type transport system permease protein
VSDDEDDKKVEDDKKEEAEASEAPKEKPAVPEARVIEARQRAPSIIWTIARKELRSAFGSAVGLVFLTVFLAVSLYCFFWVEKFFARGVTDLRPLFDWIPVLLLFLVGALSMRLWSEEQKSGTIELLLTLPVPRWKLVLGKFVAGMLLIALSLLLTFGLPITVSFMGDLDWGPVIGGYLAALLLAGAYLAIGMCVSASTDNQIVALVGSIAVCGFLYLLGSAVVADMSSSGGDTLRSLGSGSRFASIARGVLDLRDLAYYAGIIAVGLGVNAWLLGRKSWSKGPRAHKRRVAAITTIGLLAGNAIALNLWLSPIGRVRIDLTENGDYSLSDTTRSVISRLDEPLVIRGYFSAKTHPQLAPLVPRIRDLLDEYRVAGDGKVRVEIVDPSGNDEAIREAKERYDIQSTPLRFASRLEKSVINAYFNVLIEYGDQFEVLQIDDLIEVKVLDVGEVDIQLGNFEYEVTRAIKKVAAKFQSVEAMFAAMPGKVELTTYVTPKTLPDDWKEGVPKLDAAIAKLTKLAGDKIVVNRVEPEGEAQIKELFEKYGLRPYRDLMGGDLYYFHVVMKIGDRTVRIVPPQGELTEASLEQSLTEGVERASPGFTRVVGIWSPPAPPPMQMEGMPPQRLPPPQTFERLQRALSGTYDVRPVQLDGAGVPDDVEVLILAGPADLDADAAAAVDQFVMRGGSLVALAGRYRLAPSRGGLAIEKVTTGLEGVFAKWGITLGDDIVLDEKNDTFPIPIERDLGNGMRIRELEEQPYPYFLKIDRDRMTSSVITAGLVGAVMHWGSKVSAEATVGDDTRKVDVLLKSTSGAWLSSDTDVEPAPGKSIVKPTDLAADKKGVTPLAVAVIGGFSSGVPDDAPPDPGAGSGSAAPAGKRRLPHSPPDARVVVFGSSAFASDDVMGLAEQLGSEMALANLQMVQNAVDWALADTDLLSIRARSSGARALTVEEGDRGQWEAINYGGALAGIIFVAGIGYIRRRRAALQEDAS